MSTLRIQKRARKRGYTAVEVLMSMTLFAIGAAGVISMQRATIQGTEDARRYDVAMNIANTWASRLQRDAMFWNKNIVTNAPIVTAATRYVPQIGTPACTATWCTPTAQVGESPYFDLSGRDIPANPADNSHAFCVQYRLAWVANPAFNGQPAPTGFARAEVRVIFRRLDYGIIGNCANLPAAPPMTEYHFIHVTTALRENSR